MPTSDTKYDQEVAAFRTARYLITQLYHLDRLAARRFPDDQPQRENFKADVRDAYKHALQVMMRTKLISGVNFEQYKLQVGVDWVNGVFDAQPYLDSNVEIVNLMLLSTGHIPPSTADVLTRWSGNRAAPLHVSATETGWYISFSDYCTQVLKEHSGTEGVSELRDTLEYALGLGCQHIRFCEMVAPHDDLPTWNW